MHEYMSKCSYIIVKEKGCQDDKVTVALQGDCHFVNYTQPNNLAILAVRKVTTIAVPSVITTLKVAHFNDLVSL